MLVYSVMIMIVFFDHHFCLRILFVISIIMMMMTIILFEHGIVQNVIMKKQNQFNSRCENMTTTTTTTKFMFMFTFFWNNKINRFLYVSLSFCCCLLLSQILPSKYKKSYYCLTEFMMIKFIENDGQTLCEHYWFCHFGLSTKVK